MKTSLIIIVFLVLAVFGGLGLIAYRNTLPDMDDLRKDILERTLTIDGLDASVNELAIRNRYNLDSNYDALTRSSHLLDKAVNSLEQAYFADEADNNTLLSKRFADFKNELEVKKEVIENFKTHNSVLRNSQKYAPEVGRTLIDIAKNANAKHAEDLYTKIIHLMLEYGLLGSSIRLEDLKVMKSQLIDVEKDMPQSAFTEMIAFTKHLDVVIEEKEKTDAFLRKTMLATTSENLDQLSQAWGEWLTEQAKKYDKFGTLLMAYILALLLFIIIIVWALRNLYQSLDRKVEERTQQTKRAYEELKDYETQLIQSEKMASLGQLVAGISYEINTPLGYISANVDTINDNLKAMSGIYDVMKALSHEVSQSKPDSKKLVVLLRQLVKMYRENGQKEALMETQSLLDDSHYGLQEISQLVTSLKNYGSTDQSQKKSVDINKSLDTTLDMCKSLVENRQIHKNYQQLPLIECVPAHVNQVFMNVITNAIQATDDNGEITITTANDENYITVDISDNGEGMDEQTAQHVFDPFFTTRDVGQGIGLGMALAYKVIKSHGGEIVVESHESNGSKIMIKLPTKQAL